MVSLRVLNLATTYQVLTCGLFFTLGLVHWGDAAWAVLAGGCLMTLNFVALRWLAARALAGSRPKLAYGIALAVSSCSPPVCSPSSCSCSTCMCSVGPRHVEPILRHRPRRRPHRFRHRAGRTKPNPLRHLDHGHGVTWLSLLPGFHQLELYMQQEYEEYALFGNPLVVQHVAAAVLVVLIVLLLTVRAAWTSDAPAPRHHSRPPPLDPQLHRGRLRVALRSGAHHYRRRRGEALLPGDRFAGDVHLRLQRARLVPASSLPPTTGTPPSAAASSFSSITTTTACA